MLACREMAPVRLIAVALGICSSGCIPPAAYAKPAPPLRVLDGDADLASAVRRSVAARRPLPSDLPTVQGGCERFRLARPGGPRATDVIAAWEVGLKSAGSAHGWLLGPVTGARQVAAGSSDRVPGLTADGEEALVVCFDRPVPDWSARLEHPALWVAPPQTDDARGFHRTPDGRAAERRPVGSKSRHSVQRVEFVSGPGAAPGPSLGRSFDLAVVYGRDAERERALASVSPRTHLDRIPLWDATYALWIDGAGRWTGDPAFRRWLAAVLAEDALAAASFAFGEHAEPARGLIGHTEPPATPTRRPFSTTSSPRLDLAYDASDPRAEELAARLQAALAVAGADVRLVVRGASDRPALRLLAHRPALTDPVLALLETLWPLGEQAADQIQSLDHLAALADENLRRRRAEELEAAWCSDARLVPLVRVHAWLVRDARLGRVRVGSFGVLRLERAVWSR